MNPQPIAITIRTIATLVMTMMVLSKSVPFSEGTPFIKVTSSA